MPFARRRATFRFGSNGRPGPGSCEGEDAAAAERRRRGLGGDRRAPRAGGATIQRVRDHARVGAREATSSPIAQTSGTISRPSVTRASVALAAGEHGERRDERERRSGRSARGSSAGRRGRRGRRRRGSGRCGVRRRSARTRPTHGDHERRPEPVPELPGEREERRTSRARSRASPRGRAAGRASASSHAWRGWTSDERARGEEGERGERRARRRAAATAPTPATTSGTTRKTAGYFALAASPAATPGPLEAAA